MVAQGQEPAAITALQQMVKRQPADYQAWFLMGVTQAKVRQFHDAVISFQQVAKLQPKLAEPHNNLAVIYNELGDLHAAVRELESSLTLKPNYATAHENLGDLYVKLAAEAYHKALELDHQSPIRLRYERLLRLDDADAHSQKATPAAADTALATANMHTQPIRTNAVSRAQHREPAASAMPDKRHQANSKQPTASKAPTGAIAAASDHAHAGSEHIQSEPIQSKHIQPEHLQAPQSAATPAGKPALPAPHPEPDKNSESASDQTQNARIQTSAPVNHAALKASALKALYAWRDAWSRKDLARYFAAYSESFAFGQRFDSMQEWRNYKRWAIKKRAFIQVTLENIETKISPGGEITLIFLQHFRSDTFNSDDLKSLSMQQTRDGWKIIRETSK